MAAFALNNAGTQAALFSTVASARQFYSTFQSTVVAIGVAIPSRIEGASPMYKINAAAKVPFKAVDSSGAGLTGLTITAKTGKDGANPTTATNAVQESGQGWYYLTLTATEMNGEIIVLDATAAGATIAPIAIHTEADYTTARAAHLDADISSRSTYAGGAVASVTAAVTVGTNNDKAGYALSSAGVQAVWDALTSALTTVGSIGKRIADYLTGDAFARLGAPAGASIAADIATRSTYAGADTSGTTTLLARLTATRAGNLDNLDAAVSSRSTYAGADTSGTTTLLGRLTSARAGNLDFLTGDAYARLGAPSGASVSADIANISLATNAGNMATKVGDSATLVTGSNTSGSYADTASDDANLWITAPVSPAVAGFGLRQRLVFNLPLGRIPVSVVVRGYFTGTGRTVEVFALNDRTAAYDQLTNSRTDLASRSSEATYTIPLPRDYADDSGGAFNVVTLEFRSTSTTTGDRLRLNQVLIAHVAEDIAVTFTAPTAEQIWSYVTRELTTPGAEPVTVPTAADIRGEIDANSTQLAGIKAKTDNLPADPADASDIAGSFATVNGTLGTIASYIDTEVAAIKAKTDNLPAAPASSGDVSALDAALAALDAKLGTPAGASVSADVAAVKTDTAAVKTKTDPLTYTVPNQVDANIHGVNDVTVTGSGTPSAPWGP